MTPPLSKECAAVLEKCKLKIGNFADPKLFGEGTGDQESQEIYIDFCGKENARLLPIIQALLGVIDMQREALENIGHRHEPESFNLDKTFGYLFCCEDVIADATKTLTETDKRLGELGQ